MKLNEETRFVLHELQNYYDSIQHIYEKYYPKKAGKNKNDKKRKAAKSARKARKINKRHQK